MKIKLDQNVVIEMSKINYNRPRAVIGKLSLSVDKLFNTY